MTGGNVTRNQPVLPGDYGSLSATQKANLYAALRREGFTDSEIRAAAGNQPESDWQTLRRLAGYDVEPGGTTTKATLTDAAVPTGNTPASFTGTASATTARQTSNPAVTAGATNRVAQNNWGGLLAEANNPMAAASLAAMASNPLRPGLINGNANPFAIPQTRVQLPAGVTPWWPGTGG